MYSVHSILEHTSWNPGETSDPCICKKLLVVCISFGNIVDVHWVEFGMDSALGSVKDILCTDVQAAEPRQDPLKVADPEVFDDNDFYHHILQEFIQHKNSYDPVILTKWVIHSSTLC